MPCLRRASFIGQVTGLAVWLAATGISAAQAPDPNTLIAVPADPAILPCSTIAVPSCAPAEGVIVRGISDDGAVLGGTHATLAPGGFGTLDRSAGSVYRNGQWSDIRAQVAEAAFGPGSLGGTSVLAMSGNGITVAGNIGNTRAYRWAFTGPAADQGTVFVVPLGSTAGLVLGGLTPVGGGALQFRPGMPLSRDGTTVAGEARIFTPGIGNRYQAFVCQGACAVPTLLPSAFGLLQPRNAAFGVNADGTVVVGAEYGFGTAYEGFYWSSASGSVALPRPNPGAPFTGSSFAYGVSDDGGVVVGASLPTLTSTLYEATLWTRGGTLAAPTFTATLIHDPLTLGDYSIASIVNGDGTVVGGASRNGAFRWTPTRGANTLSAILSGAGVALPANLTLDEVTGLSRDGQFMAVLGTNTATNAPESFVLRYVAPPAAPVTPGAPPPETPIVGIANRDTVQRSFDRLADARTQQIVTNRVLTSVLLGVNEQVNCGDCGSGYGSVGSISGGIHGRRSLTDSLIAMGGVAFNQSQGKGYKTEASPTFALQLRFDPADLGPSRPFLNAGAAISPNVLTRYSRRYENGASPALGRGKASARILMGFASAGWVWRLSKQQEFAVYGELAHIHTRTSGWQETLSQANPFDAAMPKSRESMHIAKIGGQFTQLLSERTELNFSGGVAHAFGRQNTFSGVVPGFGVIQPAKPKDMTWAELGVRASYRVSQNFVLDAFVNGTLGGSRAAGNTAHGGFGVRLSF